jgi:hypothetical protein
LVLQPQEGPLVTGLDESGHELGGAEEANLVALVACLGGECRGQVRLARAGRDSDRLQHLRRLLPCEVRVTSAVHPLFGRLVPATGFKRREGILLLAVILPDGSPGTIPADATNVLGEPATEAGTSVLSVEGVRRLQALISSLEPGRSRSRHRRRK